jgi:hypothetical protein
MPDRKERPLKQLVFDFLGVSKVETFSDLVDKWEHFVTITSTEVRTHLNKHLTPELDAFEEYAKSADNIDIVTVNMVLDMVQDPEMRKLLKGYDWNKVVESFRFLTKVDNMDADHKEFSVVSFRMRVIYEGLLRLSNNDQIWGRTGREKREQTTIPEIKREGGKDDPITERRKIRLTKLQVVKLTEQIRRLFITSLALSELKVGDNRTRKQIVTDFINNTGQDKYSLLKKTQVDVFNDKGEVEIQLVKADFNRKEKGLIEREIGMAASAFLRQQNTKFFNALRGVPWHRFEGSEDIQSQFNKQIMQVAQGKKPRKYNSTTAKNGAAKPKNKKAKVVRNRPNKFKQIKIPPMRAAQRERPDANQERETAKLITLINKRLPAEVRRNMGRPALINQTGRFSNSVELESLRPTAGGLSGVYNYMTSPYETFENTGKMRWPTGYNPKPLIAKSVRNLAMAYTTQKLASLRRR